MSSSFSFIFVCALVLSLALRLLLALRHLNHVRQHRDHVPEAFGIVVSLQAHQKAADYTQAKVRLGLVELFLIELPVLLLLTLGGGLAWLDQFALSLAGDTIWRHLLTVVLVALATSGISLPLDYYATFSLEERFGFNRTTIGVWLADLAKSALLGVVLGVPLLLAVVWFYQAAGKLWWLYAWALWASFSLLMIWAYPKFLAPLFNKFTPLGTAENEAAVKQRVEALLQREGFESNGLFVMDGSKRSGHGNAYFTGFGKQKRIVFFDTLLTQLNVDEVEAVLAHELGHFKHGHVPRIIAVQLLLGLVFLGTLGWLAAQPWFYAGLGVPQAAGYTPGVGVALVLFSLVAGYFTFPLKPLSSLMSRKHEFEADKFAASRSGSAALISALTKLYRDNAATLTPDPLYSLVYDSHPPPSLRILELQRHG
jgi:STE24 endopeptidase